MEQLRLHYRSFAEAPDPKRIDVLDGVRALLVFLVGWFHIWQQGWLSPSLPRPDGTSLSLYFLVSTGYLWVDGLLLLSGFLLYLPYAQAGNKLPGVWAFYKRRLIRILPSYLLCVVPMFVLACARGSYPSASDAVKDLAAHLTFTHTLFEFSYFRSPINGALWTLGVEMQFYLLFPLLARAYRKCPLITWLGMTAAAFAFRYYAGTKPDTSIYVNQLPAFLDVYANGFLAATAFSALHKRISGSLDRKLKLAFTVGAVFFLCFLAQLAQAQSVAYQTSPLDYYEAVRHGQMDRRFLLSCGLAGFMICVAFSLWPLRFALGNRVMRFLASVSLQFYIYHQMLAVKLLEWHFPPRSLDLPWDSPTSPREMGEFDWQVKYTLLCFLLALVLAALITCLFERPLARLLRRRTHAEERQGA